MKYAWLAAILIAVLPSVTMAQRYDRGDRYRGDHGRSRSSFDFSIGFSSGGYRDHSYSRFSYGRHYSPYRATRYYPAPVYVPPPVVYYRPAPVYVAPAPVYVAPAPAYCPPVYSAPTYYYSAPVESYTTVRYYYGR